MKLNTHTKPSFQIDLTGYVGRKPIIKKLSNGSKLARTSVATNEVFYTLEGKRKQETQWHSIIGWGKVAEQFEQYLDKGTLVHLQGKLKVKNFSDEEGNQHAITEIEVLNFFCLTKRKIA